MRFVRTHAGPILLFGALAIAWTWPLVLHLKDALPGDPGDNYSYVWNLWWMRKALSTAHISYFHTTYLFYPFGVNIANQSHSALSAFAAATLLRPMSIVAAQNVLLLTYVFANLVAMYALAWDLTKSVRASILSAIVFGLSPYVAVHLLGHFDLVAAWPLPLYALALRRAIERPTGMPAVVAGVILGVSAYVASYYVVYLALFTVAYLATVVQIVTVTRSHAPLAAGVRSLRAVAALVAIISGALAAAIVLSGGWRWSFGSTEISLRAPQNALTAMWVGIVVWLWTVWRPRFQVVLTSSAWHRAVSILARITAALVILALPLIWQAVRLVARGEYVAPKAGWRSIPHGVDVLAPLLGHPLHPLFGAISTRGYAALGQNYVEAIGWFGVMPVVLLVATYKILRISPTRDAASAWIVVGAVFAVWSLGPFLTVGGFDTGLKLPALFVQFMPVVANARMSGRAIVVVYMAAATLIALGVTRSTGWLTLPLVQWLIIAFVAFEYWDAPIRFTSLDRPPAYQALASADPGAVCEVPFGVGDGLSTGVGAQDRRVLFYATQHEQPIVGGFISRMPIDAADRYRRMPITSTLLALSNGEKPVLANDWDVATSACRYLMVHRTTSSAELLEYVQRLRPAQLFASGEDELYRLH